MKMSKNYKRLCLALALSTVVGTGAVAAKSGTESKQATYRNIQVNYNGTNQSLALEPFLIDGSVYVPLRAFGDIVGVSANWNAASNTVSLTGGSSTSNEAEVQQLTYQNTLLQRELSEVKAKLATYESNNSTTNGTTITTAQLTASEEALANEYADALDSKISFGFDLKKSSSKLILTLNYSKSSANTAFEDLSPNKINNFLKSVCGTLAERHAGMAIEGSITYGSKDKYTFTYSKTGSYDGEAVIELNEKDIAEFIENDYDTLSSSRVNNITVNDVTVKVSDSKETITCSLYIKNPSDDDMKTWTDNKNKSDKDLRTDLSNLAEGIQTEYNTSYDVIIYLYSEANSKIAYWKDSDLSLYSWTKA